MTFAEAMLALEGGRMVRRMSWSPPDRVMRVCAYGHYACALLSIGFDACYREELRVSQYAPSVQDMSATNWEVVE